MLIMNYFKEKDNYLRHQTIGLQINSRNLEGKDLPVAHSGLFLCA